MNLAWMSDNLNKCVLCLPLHLAGLAVHLGENRFFSPGPREKMCKTNGEHEERSPSPPNSGKIWELKQFLPLRIL